MTTREIKATIRRGEGLSFSLIILEGGYRVSPEVVRPLETGHPRVTKLLRMSKRDIMLHRPWRTTRSDGVLIETAAGVQHITAPHNLHPL